jgi:hypothetical protein
MNKNILACVLDHITIGTRAVFPNINVRSIVATCTGCPVHGTSAFLETLVHTSDQTGYLKKVLPS